MQWNTKSNCGSQHYNRKLFITQKSMLMSICLRLKHKLCVSILASFCVWTKSLKCKVAVNRDSTIQSLQVRRNSSSLSTVQTIKPSRPDVHLSTVPSVRTTCHPVRMLDRPASSVWTKCSFRPDPILYREVSVPACIRPDVSAACPDTSQYSISF
jgi:hypothetical protein